LITLPLKAPSSNRRRTNTEHRFTPISIQTQLYRFHPFSGEIEEFFDSLVGHPPPQLAQIGLLTNGVALIVLSKASVRK
jgi:hypothetical protein